jgi:flagellar L-ring protein precursor FlgH
MTRRRATPRASAGLPAVAALTALAAALSGCGAAHVASYTPKTRPVPIADAPSPGASAASPGSLWREGLSASNLYTDARALRENDLVVVKVEEIANAKRSADTDITRSSKTAAALEMLMQATKQSYGLTGGVDTTFSGNGSTGRSERMTATIPCVVKKVLPNGNLYIEGHRVVLVNAEEQHYYLSGVVRPIDIDQENSVKSSVVAEAEVEFTGRGVLTDNQRQGILSQFFSWIWPF